MLFTWTTETLFKPNLKTFSVIKPILDKANLVGVIFNDSEGVIFSDPQPTSVAMYMYRLAT